MSNPRSIIKGALRSIGRIGRGRDMSAEQAADGLELLNQLVGSWKGEELVIPYTTRESLAILTAKNEYTIGSGGDFDTVRPIRVVDAFFRDTDNLDHPMTEMSLRQYNDISLKAIGTYPGRYYYNPEYPLGKLFFDYQPSTDLTLYLTSMKEITAFADLDTTIDLPSEYDRALRTNLAIELAPDYGAEVPTAIALAAQESKANIKRISQANRVPVLIVDSPHRGQAGNIYNGY